MQSKNRSQNLTVKCDLKEGWRKIGHTDRHKKHDLKREKEKQVIDTGGGDLEGRNTRKAQANFNMLMFNV